MQSKNLPPQSGSDLMPMLSLPHRASGRTLIVFGPLLAVGALGAMLAMVAAHTGWYAESMRLVATALGTAVMVLALVLYYLQTMQRRAADLALQNVVDSAMDAIVTVDEQQRIVLFNAAAEKVFGWPRDAVLGQPLEMLIPERFRRSPCAATSSASAPPGDLAPHGRQDGATAACAPTSEEFPLEASISQHAENGQQALHRDPARRHRAAARAKTLLARSEARLRGILDSAMDAIITVDEANTSCCSTPRPKRVRLPARRGARRAARLVHPRALPRRPMSAHIRRLRRGWRSIAPHGRAARRDRAAPQRRGVPDRGLDLAAQRARQRFYTVILRDVTERVLARGGAAALEGRTAASSRAAASTAREQEKSRIARELHDELGQSLTALKMDVAWLQGARRRGTATAALPSSNRCRSCSTAPSRPRAASPPTCGR